MDNVNVVIDSRIEKYNRRKRKMIEVRPVYEDSVMLEPVVIDELLGWANEIEDPDTEDWDDDSEED